MSEYITSKEYHLWYDSFEELEQQTPKDIQRVPVNSFNSNRERLQKHKRPFEWFGASSYEHATTYVRDGWPELLSILQECVETIKKRVDLASVEAVTIESRRRKRTRRDYGDTLDMHRVWSGELDKAWERPTRRRVLTPTQRYATIYCDLAMSSMFTSENAVWRAAASYCMYEMLTRLGISTEIWSGNVQHGLYVTSAAPYRLLTGVCIKTYNQTLNDDRLAAMMSGGFFRTYGFDMIYASKFEVYPHLGYPANAGLVKPLRDRQEAGERVFRVGDALSEYGAVLEVGKVVEQLKQEYARVGQEVA